MVLILVKYSRFIHNTCDPEADLSIYHAKKEINPEYEYNCPPCKNSAQNGRMVAAMRRNSSIDDDSLSASQESLYEDMEQETNEKVVTDVGLGKGKPFAASCKAAKKRLGITSSSQTGRPKGTGKFGFQKKFKFSDIGRKRGSKTKMRGVFGVPGVGLQKPLSDTNNKNDEEPGVENRLVLCSAKDKFVLTQDICVMCGAIGTDQEGCLISCVQCGQCYHPYCVPVKVTKIILQKGWRCLDCTVCEGCGQRHDESRLLLCDDCDISFHIYCIDPPLDYVPHGNWKCKWCAICQKCGSNDPGFNCSWMNSYTECGPCSSQINCPVCNELYSDGELIIQCTQCDRWLHCLCDSIKNEDEAEQCAEYGYSCQLCRPRDVPAPHIVMLKKQQLLHQQQKMLLSSSTSSSVDVLKPLIQNQQLINATASMKSPDENESGLVLGLDGNHYLDGVSLSENGLKHIKSLQLEQQSVVKKKRKSNKQQPIVVEPNLADKEAGILAAIESVVAGSSLDNSLEDIKLEPLDPKEEAEIYKDGMVWDRSDLSPPEGFTLFTTEQGVVVLRKRRQRNLQKLGIGGFSVRNRNMKTNSGNNNNKDIKDEPDELDSMVPMIVQPQMTISNTTNSNTSTTSNDNNDKKRKPIRRKPKSKLIETYPSYLQEAFFGKLLLDTTKPKFESSSSDEETKSNVSDDKTIKLSMEELRMIEAMRAKQLKEEQLKRQKQQTQQPQPQQQLPVQQCQTNCSQIKVPDDQKPPQILLRTPKTEIISNIGETTPSDGGNFVGVDVNVLVPTENNNNNILLDETTSDTDTLKDILLDNDLVNTIINDDDLNLNKNRNNIENDVDNNDIRTKHELDDILGSSHFKPMIMDSKEVEEIFKVVLTDESQVNNVILLIRISKSSKRICFCLYLIIYSFVF